MGLNGRRLALARPDGSTLVLHDGTPIRIVVPASPYVAVGGKHSTRNQVECPANTSSGKQVGFTARSRIDLSDATIENPLCRFYSCLKNEADMSAICVKLAR